MLPRGRPFMIRLSNVNKIYKLGDEEVHALADINLEIKEGEYVGILGSSGSGKSTLMHVIGLLETPTSGKVTLFDKNVSDLTDEEISKIRNDHIGFVFQQFNLIEKLSILENILLPTKYASKGLDYNPVEYAMELLTRFGISHRSDFFPNKISGGEQQRTAIARALIMKPKIILADEPTGNIDTKTGDEILDLLEELNGDLGVTIVVVTHEKEVAERTKRKIFVRDGQIVKKYL